MVSRSAGPAGQAENHADAEHEPLEGADDDTCPQSRTRFAQKAGEHAEWEVFSPTHLLQDVMTLLKDGLDEPPYFINFVLGAERGFQGAMPYSPKILQSMVDLMPDDAIFNVSAIGISQLNAALQSLLLGGHVRVGLEDNLYYAQGELATNVQLTERIVRIIRDLGMEPATPDEARAIIGLPRGN